MNKEDILKQAQQENNGKDIADLEAQRRGTYFAYMVGVLLLVFVELVEGFVLHRSNYGCNMAIFVMATVAFVTKYRMLHKKHERNVALFYGALSALWLVLWILQLCGVIG